MKKKTTAIKSFTTKANANRAGKRISTKYENIADYEVVGADGLFVLEFDMNCQFDAIPLEIKEDHFCKFKAAHVAEEAPEPKKEILRKSKIKKPCYRVWDIADEMTDARRKDVIAACVAEGIAFYTARTQYQLWKQANAATTKTEG